MSERQAKKQRKVQPQEKVKAAKKSATGFNVFLALIIVAAIVIGGYVIYNQYKIKNPSMDPETVSDRAKSEGISVEEFEAKYGIDTVEEVDGDTEMTVASGYMSLEKYAEFEGKTVDELKAEFGFSDDVTNDMMMKEAQEYIPMSKAAESMGVDYASLMQMYGLTEEEVPQDMLFKDAKPILEAAQQKLIAESQASEEAPAEAE
ncbi:MAG: hypothetical protein KIG65_02595 [Eubacteriales bacterium]|nr:hypothetical protein [Eubacteriales bacterium]